MKISLLSLLFFILTFTTKPLHSAESDVVLDIDGNEVRVGPTYYIIPSVLQLLGGGLTFRGSDTKPCQLTVAQDRCNIDTGRPVIFSQYVRTKDGVVRQSTDINIKFINKTKCGESTVWKVSRFGGTSGKFLVTDGGHESRKDEIHYLGSELSLFKINSTESGYYKLVFDPSVRIPPGVPRGELDIFIDNGIRRAQVVEEKTKFEVSFVRVNSPSVKRWGM
ncbi:latex serine proteinase inhibitor-like [Carica papaya]|uniref:latex serine proteinase inhibitor-like n=1 Tax=Carica papaya TaxID=3649 RepID=UPI000B8CCB8E|nr:latex serine proteinase inhibitor-like [Carica papaya]